MIQLQDYFLLFQSTWVQLAELNIISDDQISSLGSMDTYTHVDIYTDIHQQILKQILQKKRQRHQLCFDLSPISTMLTEVNQRILKRLKWMNWRGKIGSLSYLKVQVYLNIIMLFNRSRELGESIKRNTNDKHVFFSHLTSLKHTNILMFQLKNKQSFCLYLFPWECDK